MAKEIRVLGIHGLGDHRLSGWKKDWEAAVRACFDADALVDLEFAFIEYDDIFAKTDISFAETMRALWKLGASGLGSLTRRQRGLTDISDRVRWTAGYVVAWVEDEDFQTKTRSLVLDEVRRFKPDVILAHSLGSLITYNAFTHAEAGTGAVAKVLKGAHYVTLGSQIGNPFVVGNLTHGRIRMPGVRHWHHLYNEHDDVFTAEIRLQGVAEFSQLLTPFDDPGIGDHAATGYLAHSVTAGSLWRPLTLVATGAKVLGKTPDPWARAVPRRTADRGRKAEPGRKALLVGINEYPREADRLAGCVNDVFTMSAVLQECGFAPEQIRTCLDDRATASGILSRLEWLLDGAQPGDQLVFYYSGHGARVPEYGEFDEPDRLTETLVPWDFDWTPETSISDEQIFSLYSQLPYEAQFMLFFDCCHAGSMHRQSGAKARGISPPDDIRHRQLKWDLASQMWVDRDFQPLNPAFSPDKGASERFFGGNRATVRLGRATMLRRDSEERYEAARKASKAPVGPYLPLIIEACGENELSYEYRHGATSYGAFTFCLASILREEKNITYGKLVTLVGERLRRLQYDQTPQILGPSTHLDAKVPWRTGQADRPPSRGKPGSSTPRLSG
jgi:hypothetical protein